MIISKDLFIFGEQIFATIIPEGGSSQGSPQQQQPAIINTATVGVSATAQTAAATSLMLQIPTAATVVAAAAATTTTTTTTATVGAAEQVAVVVVVEQTNKLQKIPKEFEEQPKNKKKEKLQLQQQQKEQQQQQQLKNITDEKIIGINTKIIQEEQTPTKTTTTHKQIIVAVEDVEEEEDDDDDDDGEQETVDEAAEKEPLVKRNLTKILTAAGTTTTTTATALIPTAITATSSAAAAGKEIIKTLKQQQQQEPKHQQPQTDCRLQLEPEILSSCSSSTSTSSCCSSTLVSLPANTATAKTTSSSTIIVTDRNDDVDQVANIINSEDSLQLNMGNKTRSDHTMVTFPFISEQHRTLQLKFQNINVLHNERKILSDVSGLVSPGEVLAIMGPSGSGKTTLLDCLSGQRRIDSGSIYLNREPLSKKWRRKICYVLQEEVFFSGLTLRETVMYTALLRLPEKMPKEEKMKLVDRILEALELNFCQQTKFGDYLNRGLSGGEKKRANIACELLTNPLLMLLDEPTSGLDSHSAISLMKVLKRYAMQEQKTVVITVHQPSSQMFHMFDKLLLLYNGRTAYFGEVNNIYRYFEDIGVAIKPHYNPADFVLEQLKSYPDIREKLFVAAKESHGNFLNRNCITVNHHHNQQQHHHHHMHHNHCHHSNQQNGGITVTSTNGTSTNATPNANATVVTTTPIDNDKTDKHHDTLINDIISNYYKDIHNNHINHDAMLMMGNHHTTCEEAEAAQQLWCGADSQSNFSSASSSDFQQYESSDDWLDYPTHFHTQFRVLSSRNFKEAKPRMLSKLNWFQTVGLALMAGAIWFQIPRTEEFLHDLQGWMFFSQTYWMLFALFGALNSFPSEREVISKERRSGAYRLSAYYLAKMFGELPLVITLPTVYLMISYPMLGCTSFKLFFLMLVFLLLNTIVAQSVGFFIGACCMDMNVSITLSALYTLATQLFGGYLSSRIPDGLSWIRYTSMIHYAYQNMQILEFREGPAIRCGNPSSYEICKDNTTTTASGTTTTTTNTFIPYEEILKAQNSNSPLWLNTLVLMMFFMVFRGLGYAVLRYVRCPKT